MKMRGDKIPTDRGTGENTPLPNYVGKKSANDAGQQQGHNTDKLPNRTKQS